MTITKALKKIFSEETGGELFRKWKSRFKSDMLSIDKQEDILKDFGYKKIKESVWKAPK